LVVLTKLHEKGVKGKSEKGAAERISLLDSRFAADEGHTSIVEKQYVTFAAIMCLDVSPKDLPPCRSAGECGFLGQSESTK
jgi:hypothetical protein